MKRKLVFCWSGGKDSALALHRLLHDERYEIVSLMTTCNERFRRVSMHGVRVELCERQANAIGLPLDTIWLSERSSNEEYAEKMTAFLSGAKERGVTGVAFGDIYLEDLRAWRESNLAQLGLDAIFPLWKDNPRALIEEFVALGFRSIVCCVNDAHLDRSALGRVIDRAFVESLPPGVDPCGENGEFHSFAFAGPIFDEPIAVEVGDIVYRPLDAPSANGTKGFWFCDLTSSP